MYKKIVMVGAMVFIPALLLSLPPESKRNMEIREPCPYRIVRGTKGDRPADWWMVAWMGIGDVTDYMISNTLQGGGPFVRPPDWYYYDGTFPWWSIRVFPGIRGLAVEYPAGTYQYYTFGSGLWVNAGVPVIEDGDTTWVRKGIETAYSSDLGAMSSPEMADIGGMDYSGLGLYFSTQRIAEGDGEGDFLFVQTPGDDPKPHQGLWPFADTLINRRRPDPATWVDPARGDVISLEDTYAVAGDWIPPGDATSLWIRDAGPYAGTQVGLRIEERTYSWDFGYNDAYIYINWKIRNMNDFPLRDVYVAHFMDNDIGSGIVEPGQGAKDDMMGFCRDRKLVYSFDADGFEPGWETVTGFVGSVMLETPFDRGLTSVKTWLFGDPIDEDLQDVRRYEYMSSGEFMTWTIPRDIRQLSSSGPFDLEAGEEVDFTVAIVVAKTLDELKSRAEVARIQFEIGYLGFAPPPSPVVDIVPGDGRVYLSWDGERSEGYVCPMTDKMTFEGYRIYRSPTGIAGSWELLAEYDLIGTYTIDTVIAEHAEGISTAEIEFLEFYDVDRLKKAVYSIDFTEDRDFVVFNLTEGVLYAYNPDAEADGEGFSIKPAMGEATYKTHPGYIPHSVIYIGGFYVTIRDGKYDPSAPGTELSPRKGERFIIRSYPAELPGREAGIRRYFVDEGLINGIIYYYSVNAFSRPIPHKAVEELESGFSGKKYWAIPRAEPVDYEFSTVSEAERIRGTGDIIFSPTIANSNNILDAEYRIRFGTDIPGDDAPDFFWMVRVDEGEEMVVIDTTSNLNLETNPTIDGFTFRLATIPNTVVDEIETGWITGVSDCILSISMVGNPRHDYHIIFSDTGSYDMRGSKAPFEVWNIDRGEPVRFLYIGDSASIYPPGGVGTHAVIAIFDSLMVYDSSIVNDTLVIDTTEISWRLTVTAPSDSNFVHPGIGDIYLIDFQVITTIRDEFTITTSSERKKAIYSLADVRVVPNPFFVSAVWDGPTRFDRKLYFQGLPSRCTIRIFNAAGLLIRTIKHDETVATHFRPEGMGHEEPMGAHAWDLKTTGGFEVVSGLYIFQITTPDGQEKIGKFAVVR